MIPAVCLHHFWFRTQNNFKSLLLFQSMYLKMEAISWPTDSHLLIKNNSVLRS